MAPAPGATPRALDAATTRGMTLGEGTIRATGSSARRATVPMQQLKFCPVSTS